MWAEKKTVKGYRIVLADEAHVTEIERWLDAETPVFCGANTGSCDRNLSSGFERAFRLVVLPFNIFGGVITRDHGFQPNSERLACRF